VIWFSSSSTDWAEGKKNFLHMKGEEKWVSGHREERKGKAHFTLEIKMNGSSEEL
jgi:hypothetical protein